MFLWRAMDKGDSPIELKQNMKNNGDPSKLQVQHCLMNSICEDSEPLVFLSNGMRYTPWINILFTIYSLLWIGILISYSSLFHHCMLLALGMDKLSFLGYVTTLWSSHLWTWWQGQYITLRYWTWSSFNNWMRYWTVFFGWMLWVCLLHILSCL